MQHKAVWEANHSHVFSWSSIYTFSTSGSLGITAMGTLVEGGSIVGVPAADYALTSMSELLLPWIVGANATYTWVYIIERENGMLVASTVDGLTIESAEGWRRRKAVESESPGVVTSREKEAGGSGVHLSLHHLTSWAPLYRLQAHIEYHECLPTFLPSGAPWLRGPLAPSR